MSPRPRSEGRPRLLALAGAALLGVCGAARADSAVWSTHGPPGGNVYCVIPDPSHPSIVYAGTAQGVFRSDDAGISWKSASVGLPPATRVQTIVVDPTATSTLYAGTVTPNGVESVGIFKSTDGAATWTASNAGLIDPITGSAPLDVASLAIDLRNPSTILAGTRFSEIFKSKDGGVTWQTKTFGGFDAALQTTSLLFHPANSSIVYAAGSLGLLRSTDGGETWDFYGNAGVPLYALAVDPTSPATLYAGNATGFGIIKSTDGGGHWSAANSGLPVLQNSAGSYSPLVTSLAVDPAHPSTVYVGTYGSGIFQTANAAGTWTAAASGMRDAYVTAVTLAPGSSSTLYAGTQGGGVYESLDAARSWTPSNSGLLLGLVYSVALDPTAPGTLFAATFEGVQTSADGGASWQTAHNGLPAYPVAALTVVPGSPQKLFAGTLGGGLFRSSDGGASWAASGQGLNDTHVSSLAVDPSSATTLYAGTAHPYDGSRSERVYKSTDGGASWTQTSLDATSFSIDFLAVNPAQPSQVVAGSKGVVGYFQSLDAGKTWAPVSTSTSCGGLNAVLFDRSGSPLFLAGTAGVCRSTDSGKTWSVGAVGGGYSIGALAADPSTPSVLYAGTAFNFATGASGVFVSGDGGATWTAVGTGFPAVSVTAIGIDGSGKALHAATFGSGVVELIAVNDRQPPVESPAGAERRSRALNPR